MVLSKFAMEKWMVLHQALLDCLADCSYPITFELLTSLPPVVCAAFEKLENVRVASLASRPYGKIGGGAMGGGNGK